MFRQSSFSCDSCTSTITEIATVHSQPSLTTLLLSSKRQPELPKAPPHPQRHPSRKRSRRRRHKSRPSSLSIQTHTRSSRLFFLLLHLVGVSTNLHKKRQGWPGITAVHPAKTIYLQRLKIENSQSLGELVHSFDGDLLQDPFWFQDSDGRCLGIGGFGECGDTLWRIRRREGPKRKRQANVRVSSKKRQRKEDGGDAVCVWPFFCERDSSLLQSRDSDGAFELKEQEGFALEMVDINEYEVSGHKLKQRPKRRRFLWVDGDEDQYDEECLVSFPSEGSSLLQLGSCWSEQAWMWHINRDGVLMRGLTKSERRKFNKRRWIGSPITAGRQSRLHSITDVDVDMLCLHKANTTDAALLPCQTEKKYILSNNAKGTLVGFSLVRYPSASYRLSLDSSYDENQFPWITLEGSLTKQTDNEKIESATIESSISEYHMPSSRTSSHNHASNTKQRHVEVKSTLSMLHTGLDQGSTRKHRIERTSASHIRDAPSTTVEGIPFHIQHPVVEEAKQSNDDETNPGRIIKTSLLHKEKPQNRRTTHLTDQEYSQKGDSEASAHHRPIKIPVHPYIEASKDGVWTDPLTSLTYPTDLCEYLGHTKQEYGRQTLMGVGQYFRTAFNIKVYGAALYVAKRDVLADPKFARYATLSSEELQKCDDFYEHLMNMPSPGEDPNSSVGGFFDRTLMVKTNMQLSTDAMRKSLEADWSLLTDEMKTLIIESSFRERSADNRMLAKIQNKENSSNCSCGQKAPDEYNAEPSCCARGTELAFTWRKNGNFEVRLDGRVMDVFPRPDMARGIFSEYLNKDPISSDAKGHFADGFPFLLAPLAQVKGMSSAVPIASDSTKKIGNSSGNPMVRLMMHPVNLMNSQAHTMSKWMHDGAAEISSTLDDALDNAVGIARGVSAEFEKRRMELLDNAFALHDEINSLINSSLERHNEKKEGHAALIIGSRNGPPSVAPSHVAFDENDFRSNLPDELGIEVEPTMNFSHWLFFATVHVYLLLLVVVSLQDSSYTSKKCVVSRRTK